MGNKKTKGYDPEAFKQFGKYLEATRRPKYGDQRFSKIEIDLEGLEKALKALPKQDRDRIEKFWGITGGVNHSKNVARMNGKDIAYSNMRQEAFLSVRILSRLDYVKMYVKNFEDLIRAVCKKINKAGVEHISDIDSVKYLIAYLILVENGPKMSFEQELMTVETKIDQTCYLDEYEALSEMYEEISKYKDNSINLSLVINFFNDALYLADSMSVRSNFGIQDSMQEESSSRNIEIIQIFGEIRRFKERVFEYGPWEVTSQLVLGYTIDLREFGEVLNEVFRDWKKIDRYKKGQKKLKTSGETRILDIYCIGDLEFTDPNEIQFLYLERNCINM